MLIPLLFLIAFLYGNWTDICQTVDLIYQNIFFIALCILSFIVVGFFVLWISVATNSLWAGLLLLLVISGIAGALTD